MLYKIGSIIYSYSQSISIVKYNIPGIIQFMTFKIKLELYSPGLIKYLHMIYNNTTIK